MRLIFHLGYPRTATTFLQTHIFPIHKQINFLGPKNYYNWNNVKITQETLDKFKDFYFLKKKNDFINKTLKHFDKDKLNIISTERYLSYHNVVNNFYDCKYIEDFLDDNDLEISFLIVLRNQYDLIRSFYFHGYRHYSKFLGIKSFKKLVNLVSNGLENSPEPYHLKLFLEQYDFNLINTKLQNLFKNIKIKYLFYEDLKYKKNLFIDEFSDFLKLDSKYTQNLFNNKIENETKSYKKNEYVYVSSLKHKIITNKIFRAFKKKFPFKDLIREPYLKYFVYSTKEKIYDEDRLKNIIKEYYKFSNQAFFKHTKLENKFDY